IVCTHERTPELRNPAPDLFYYLARHPDPLTSSFQNYNMEKDERGKSSHPPLHLIHSHSILTRSSGQIDQGHVSTVCKDRGAGTPLNHPLLTAH
ncbi:hypothetical protein AVEN_256131-1, partial [Araneus ventricosus]